MTNTWFDNGMIQLYQADARSLPIPDNSVDCVVTSPPYWGLRDYGLGDQGIGLEPTPEAYCANMIEVFREVWRVLKPTGTVWLNLGDSYAGGGGNSSKYSSGPNGIDKGRDHARPVQSITNRFSKWQSDTDDSIQVSHHVPRSFNGLKPKDLVGIPWRVAFALQADGWYLRSDIIWSKPNPMPESVTDRPTKAHEYIFLLTKSPKYYYDADAIRTKGMDGDRNKRSVWEIATQPYPEAHFATYPEKLVEPCILAGTSEKGVCAECGKPWERTFERIDDRHWTERGNYNSAKLQALKATGFRNDGGGAFEGFAYSPTGWQPTCECNADTVPATVLDPFAGSATTLAVAQRLGRKGIGIELNSEYIELAVNRLTKIPLPLLL